MWDVLKFVNIYYQIFYKFLLVHNERPQCSKLCVGKLAIRNGRPKKIEKVFVKRQGNIPIFSANCPSFQKISNHLLEKHLCCMYLKLLLLA